MNVSKTLFLGWQFTAKGDSRSCPMGKWYPLGRLDEDSGDPLYRFRFINGAVRAQEDRIFVTKMVFPKLDGDYRSRELFAVFRNRVINESRPERPRYLRLLGLDEKADPFEIMAISGGVKMTDYFITFPKLERDAEGWFACRFFLRVNDSVNQPSLKRVADLKPDEPLLVSLELNHPTVGAAVQMLTEDYHMIGWGPDYLANELKNVVADEETQIEAKVVLLNDLKPRHPNRLLIGLRFRCETYEPMSGPEYEIVSLDPKRAEKGLVAGRFRD